MMMMVKKCEINSSLREKIQLIVEGCSRRNVKREEGSGQEKISDDRQHHDK